MTINQLLQEAAQTLGPQGDLLGAEVLLARLLKKDRAYFLAYPHQNLYDGILDEFKRLFSRMVAGEPVAYLIGTKEFYGLEFMVDRRVLIPRPETEHLVERVLLDYNDASSPVRVLDVGTGSGCVAISLAKYLTTSRVVAVDISNDALDVARINAERLGVTDRIQFLKNDLLENLEGPFDVIVANLPYIGTKKFSFVTKSAYDYEPHVALFSGEDGLSLYRRFFEQLASKCWKPKVVLGEFGFLQKDELESVFHHVFPELHIRFEQDYAHIDRIFVVDFPSE